MGSSAFLQSKLLSSCSRYSRLDNSRQRPNRLLGLIQQEPAAFTPAQYQKSTSGRRKMHRTQLSTNTDVRVQCRRWKHSNVRLEFMAASVYSEGIKEAVGLKWTKNRAAQETGFSSDLTWISAHTASLEEQNHPLKFGFLTIQHKKEKRTKTLQCCCQSSGHHPPSPPPQP